MKTTKKSILSIATLLFASVLLFSACKKDEVKDPGKAPQLPPLSSMLMDFSAINHDDTSTNRNWVDYLNWSHSFHTILGWKLASSYSITVPWTIFSDAINHEAIYSTDGHHWIWNYTVNEFYSVYDANLTGEVQNDSVYWEMKISQKDGYQNFLWFYGKSAINNSGGYWILMDSHLNAFETLRIDWLEGSEPKGYIKYTSLNSLYIKKDNFLFFEKTSGLNNRHYIFYSHLSDNFTDIEINLEGRDGRVKDPDNFNDDNWHCWDSDKADTECD